MCYFADVATPIAASLGDLTTLGLLAAIATWLFNAISTFIDLRATFSFALLANDVPNLVTVIANVEAGLWWISPCILAAYMASVPWLICVASSHPLTKEVLYTGWSPVLAAMTISRYKASCHVLGHKVYNRLLLRFLVAWEESSWISPCRCTKA